MKFNNDIEKFEFFESVLNNKVSYPKIQEFEEAMIQDDSLAAEFDDYRNLHELVIDHSVMDMNERLAAIHQEATNHPGKGKGFSGNNLIISILTGVMVISTTLFFLLRDQESVKTESATTPGKTEQKTEPFPEQKNPIENKEPSVINVVNEEKKENLHPIVSSAKKESKGIDPIQSEENKVTEPDPIADNVSDNAMKDNMMDVSRDSFDTLLRKNQSVTSKLMEEEEAFVDCKSVKISLTFEIVHSCIEKIYSGKIIIAKNSINGGTSPYSFSINGGKEYFESEFLFNYLSPGNYQLFVRDINQCEEKIAEVYIEEKICQKDYKYSPVFGEPWIIPLEKGKDGIFRLFSRSGQILVEKRIDDFSDNTWYGKDDNNDPLNMGYFPFIIQYSDGELFKGSVTLVK